MAELAYLGRLSGVGRALSGVSSALGLSVNIKTYEHVDDVIAPAKASKVLLAGPSLAASPAAQSKLAKALGLHTAVYNTLSATSARSTLYANTDVTTVMAYGADDIAVPEEPSFLPVATRAALHSLKSDISLMESAMSKTVSVAVEKAAKSGSLRLLFKEHVDVAAFETLSRLAAEAAKDKVKFATVPNGLALNWATMTPEKLSVVLCTSSDYSQLFVKLLEGLAGGERTSAYSWIGEQATVYHTGSFLDSETASPAGLILALSQLLADRGDVAASKKLHAALTKTVQTGIPELKVLEFAEKVAKNL